MHVLSMSRSRAALFVLWMIFAHAVLMRGPFARHLGSNSVQIFRIMSPWISETSGKMERSRMGTSVPLEPLENVSMFTEHRFVACSMWRYRYQHQRRERCWWKWRRPASILSIGEYRMGYWSIFYPANFLTSQVTHSTHRLRLINCSSCSASNLSVNNREQQILNCTHKENCGYCNLSLQQDTHFLFRFFQI